MAKLVSVGAWFFLLLDISSGYSAATSSLVLQKSKTRATKKVAQSEQEKVDGLIRKTEASIAELLYLDAPTRFPNEMQKVQALFDDALTSRYEENYSDTLTKLKKADAQIDKLLIELRKFPAPSITTVTKTRGTERLYPIECDHLHWLIDGNSRIGVSSVNEQTAETTATVPF